MDFTKPHALAEEFLICRQQTLNLVSTLEIEDFVPQAAEFTSPPRWHLAHTSWLFEMLLQKHDESYKPYDADYLYQFNSYYERFGERIARPERGHRSRPTVQQILKYRAAIDERVQQFFARKTILAVAERDFKMGIEHEKQHQELLVWDIKFHLIDAFKVPFRSAFTNTTVFPKKEDVFFEEGIVEVGYNGTDFSWDNERPLHKQYVHAYSIDSLPVTVGEYLEFVEHRGYDKAEYWLSDGWKYVQTSHVQAPQYWEKIENSWHVRDFFGLRAACSCEAEPVAHVSYYEADAYARWKQKRLPSEAEWERACQKISGAQPKSDFLTEPNSKIGIFLDEGCWRPGTQHNQNQTPFFFGLWEWTTSDYSPFPGFRSDFEEYNDKWFINQKVLRGGSYATWRNHYRLTYRNFFYPHDRWIGTGFRCARTIL